MHPLGPENHLKSIDFTGPWGGLSPHSPPPLNTLKVTHTMFVSGQKLLDIHVLILKIDYSQLGYFSVKLTSSETIVRTHHFSS